jgi:hypothetical protein
LGFYYWILLLQNLILRIILRSKLLLPIQGLWTINLFLVLFSFYILAFDFILFREEDLIVTSTLRVHWRSWPINEVELPNAQPLVEECKKRYVSFLSSLHVLIWSYYFLILVSMCRNHLLCSGTSSDCAAQFWLKH